MTPICLLWCLWMEQTQNILRESVELEEDQHDGTSKVKKKEGKITEKSTCQRSKKTPIEVTDVR